MKSKFVLAALAAVLVLNGADAFAAGRLLGATALSGVPDRDVILVPGLCPSPANPMVVSVQITVRHRPAHIETLAVRYGNGIWDNLPVRERFGAGTSSRWIDLRGGARCVEAIGIIGQSLTPRQALVEVRGR